MDGLIVILLLAALAIAANAQLSIVAVALGLLALGLSALRLLRGRWPIVPLLVVSGLQVLLSLVSGNGFMPVWITVLMLALLGLAVLVLWWLPVPHLPAPGGPNNIGITRVDIPGSAMPQGPGASADRRAQLYIWYPANPAPGSRPRRLQTHAEASAFANSFRALGGPAFFFRHFQLARTHSHPDAAPREGNYPLVVFNHGGALWPTQNFSLMEELASHGYISCAIAHPGDSAGIAWQDGTTTPIDVATLQSMRMQGEALRDHARFLLCQDPAQKRALLAALRPHYEQTLGAISKKWAARSVAAVDWLFGGDVPEYIRKISARLDQGKVAYCGMSLGGSVAHECCFLDARAGAGINLDGMNWAFERIEQAVPVPFLQICGDPIISIKMLQAHADADFAVPEKLSAQWLMYNDSFYEAAGQFGTRADVIRLICRGAGHMAFTDHALAARGPMRKFAGIGQINGRKVIQSVNRLCREFLDHAIKHTSSGDFAASLDNSSVMIQQQPSAKTSV